MKKKKVFVCAGEASADLYAALFLKQHQPFGADVELVGVGGPQLEAAGTRIVLPSRQLAVFGFADAATGIAAGIRAYRRIARLILQERPDVFIAVAYPGLNSLLTRFCKQRGIKTVYLLPPQIWAWGSFRKYFIRKYVDLVVSFFPFESRFYRRRGINTVGVRNPLIDYLNRTGQRTPEKHVIGLMPGSRPSQIKRHLPMMLDLARRLWTRDNNLRFRLILLPTVSLPGDLPSYVEVAQGDRYRAMARSRFIVLASGTASLESGLLGIPHLFCYHAPLIDRLAAVLLLETKEINLVNILLGKKAIVVHINPTPDALAASAWNAIVQPEGAADDIREQLEKELAGYAPASPNAIIEAMP